MKKRIEIKEKWKRREVRRRKDGGGDRWAEIKRNPSRIRLYLPFVAFT